ncbi:BREX-1 system adenine-specific DNA-methyltransferase PglX [Cellulomonas cellasea]|uniref:BREX-1 system adenine-specific DNA-methyltransferase PglX n=1 Tax=Cellulomonas cellasea TaxID=43670 RepID=UPI0025A41FE7|nr:BREX-1 system adenine-specific DNA-methyltransferase PglX [Cellulomonas cellasea]MDM8085948.1 BREX-1 system adenine-specific DNA-methyltransferase PglX [Cellulomonas cellasea]
METAPLKSFATWARTALIREVTARIAVVLAPASLERVEQPRVVAAVEKAVSRAGGGDKGKAAVADRVAYTWFNRIIALRFMDANGYTGVGVVSPQSGVETGQPEILAEAKRGNIDAAVAGTKTRETVTGLLNGTRRSDNAQGEAYALLLADYCRYWNRAMPFMFEREGDFTELLIPGNLLADDSAPSRAVKVLTSDVCKDVEVIGWLYQFYISDRKDEVFAGFNKNKKAGADEIPAATQLFTPHWIVRYLVENSLGRLWMLNRPGSRLVDQMQYYIAPIDEEADFVRIGSPEELKVVDPACGSGHMLTYAFDLLYAIYEEEGYAPAEIPGLILTNNLYGVEIDPRAGALAAFALTMKARAKQRTLFSKRVEPNVCVLEPISFTPDEIDFLLTRGGDKHAELAFWNQFAQANVTGSLVKPNRAVLEDARRGLTNANANAVDGDILVAELLDRAAATIRQADVLSRTYHVAVANPPYMGSGNMETTLANFAKSEYPLAKIDLYAMFIDRCFELVDSIGAVAMVTQDSWMFLGAYAKYRVWLLNRASLATLAHLGTSAFDTISGEVVSTVAFVANTYGAGVSRSVFVRAADVESGAKADVLMRAAVGSEAERTWVRSVSEFLDVPNTPVVYWASDGELAALRKGPYLGELLQAREGLTTGNNDRFLRRWYEVSQGSIGFGIESTEESVTSGARWFPYQKGGSSRRWYGNFDFVVDWEDDGERPRANIDEATGRVRSHNYNGTYGFKRGLTWSGISGDGFAVRDVEGGFMFDAKGPMAFPNREDELRVLEGFLNSSTATRFMRLLAPRLDFKLGHVLSLPVRVRTSDRVSELGTRCIDLSKQEWDADELSAHFQGSPLLGASQSLSAAVDACNRAEDVRAESLATAEEELDNFFATAYLGEQATGKVVRLPEPANEDARRRAHVEDLVSYAIGSMFGRYSLDEPGLILADQGATVQDYLAKVPNPTFGPDRDNVIPIVDGDWFEDDIVARFRSFLRVAFGEQCFEENLRFVTESLGIKDIREYFVRAGTRAASSKFYDDHVQRYKKRPIYWLFSSPKGSFSALIYMHRYTPSTVSTVLNEYLREFRAKLASSLQQKESLAAGGGTPRQQAAAQKEADRLRKVLLELEGYEHDVLYPLASRQLSIDLDDGVKTNYPKFGAALKKIPGLEASDE